MDKIIGKNLKACRELNKFTQDQVANFLGINRSAYSNYELGDRETPMDVLERCADLYGSELALFFEEDNSAMQEMLTCAFRVDDLSNEDMVQMANFKSIVKSYLKINTLLQNE